VGRRIGDCLGQMVQYGCKRARELVELLHQTVDLPADHLSGDPMGKRATGNTRRRVDSATGKPLQSAESPKRRVHRIKPIACVVAVEQPGEVTSQVGLETLVVHPSCCLRLGNGANLGDDRRQVNGLGGHGRTIPAAIKRTRHCEQRR
jgi:hypothetical protein